jgi:hypothetical protein
MKTIGFIDYFLHEWHANEYPSMIKEYNQKHGTDYQLKYAWAEIDSPNGGLTTDEWCKTYGAERCQTIEELCKKCDFVFVLAPSNPEKHLAYAGKVFKAGKSPYIDKTFAPDFKTAKAIFDLANECGVKFFSSSALRYSDEIKDYDGEGKTAFTTGGGSNMEEYIIHQVEMVVKCLGQGAKAVRYEKHADNEWAEVIYEDQRNAKMLFAPCLPFAITVSSREERSAYLPINSAFFNNLIADIFNFFETGKTSFDTAQTLEVMKIREGVIKAKERAGELIDL